MYPLHVSPRLLLFIQPHLMLKYNDPSIHDTIERIEVHGGSFATALITTFRLADPENKQRIIDTWPELFQEFGPKGIFASPQQRVHSFAYEWTKELSIYKKS